jgi:hypothetical protein
MTLETVVEGVAGRRLHTNNKQTNKHNRGGGGASLKAECDGKGNLQLLVESLYVFPNTCGKKNSRCPAAFSRLVLFLAHECVN